MYIYDDLRKDCCRLCREGVECGSIGRSLGGAHIVYFHLGPKDAPQMIVQGGMHAREWITSLLVARQAYMLRREALPLGIYFVPMTNPDGCTLAQVGADAFPSYRELLLDINGSPDFSMWKANLRGVDINVNFDARWGSGKGNLREPAPASFIGDAPASEPETAALVRFTRAVDPVMTVSYHALGREVYYEFGQSGEALKRDAYFANKIAHYLGYRLVPGDLGSAGGYKDFCVSALGIPAVTIEIVSEAHSHPLCEADLIGEDKNIWLPVYLAKLLKKNLCAPR